MNRPLGQPHSWRLCHGLLKTCGKESASAPPSCLSMRPSPVTCACTRWCFDITISVDSVWWLARRTHSAATREAIQAEAAN